MSRRADFERIVGWSDRQSASLESARDDFAACASMVAGVEYELQQLRRGLRSIEKAVTAPQPVDQCRTGSAHDLFNAKLRHPGLSRERLSRLLWLD
jgi:hypothetical protein